MTFTDYLVSANAAAAAARTGVDMADISPKRAAQIDALNANAPWRELFELCANMDEDQIAAMKKIAETSMAHPKIKSGDISKFVFGCIEAQRVRLWQVKATIDVVRKGLDEDGQVGDDRNAQPFGRRSVPQLIWWTT